MNARLIGEKFIRVMRRDGFWNATQLAISYLRSRPSNNQADGFDAMHGTDTDGSASLWDFQIDSPNARFGVRYEASDPGVLNRAVTFMREDPRSLTFIDLGCGKRRMLLLAWKLGFRKIVGVEFVPELVKVAEAYLRRVGASNAFVFNADAAQFSFPDDDFVLYLFNPFGVEVMRNVVENLGRAEAARRFVIYNAAFCADVFDSSGFLNRIGYVPETQYPTIIWTSAKQEPSGKSLHSSAPENWGGPI